MFKLITVSFHTGRFPYNCNVKYIYKLQQQKLLSVSQMYPRCIQDSNAVLCVFISLLSTPKSASFDHK